MTAELDWQLLVKATDAAFPGLPAAMTLDEAQRRVRAAVEAVAPDLMALGAEAERARVWQETREHPPWRPGELPEPDELAWWLKVCTDERRLQVAESWLVNAKAASACFQRDHEGEIYQLKARMGYTNIGMINERSPMSDHADRSHDTVTVYERTDGKFDWHRKDPQGRVLDGDEGQGYENESEAFNMATDLNPGIKVVIAESAKLAAGEGDGVDQ